MNITRVSYNKAVDSNTMFLTVEGSAEKKLRNGMTLVMPQLNPGQYRVYGAEGEFLALCAAEDGKLTTVKSFFEV